jgi:glycogen debranching enzyme
LIGPFIDAWLKSIAQAWSVAEVLRSRVKTAGKL